MEGHFSTQWPDLNPMLSKTSNPNRKRPVVGVRIPPWATFARPVFDGIMDHMRLHGWWELQTENNASGELQDFRIDEGWSGDGIITFRCTPEELAAWKKRGIAVVNFSSEGEAGGFPRVIPDNFQVGKLAAEHLRECGLTNFAFISRGISQYEVRKEWVSGDRRYGRERWAGFSEELARTGHRAAPFFLPPLPYDNPDTWRSVLREIRSFLEGLPRPCGVFAVDDLLGVSVLRAASLLGLRVPQDISMVAFGDDKVFCHLVTPAMSSIRYPGREIGLEAARRLEEQLSGDAPKASETLVPVSTITPRESSDFLSIADEEVARLVRIIRERALREPLQVAEVFDLTKLSPTVVKKRFNAAMGHGPKREILNARIRHLGRLLSETRLNHSDIADAMGFSSVSDMARFLERHAGRRPADYRAGHAPA